MGCKAPALCIPHSSQAPLKPLEVWLEHGLQSIVGNKISDNGALCVQRLPVSKNCFPCHLFFHVLQNYVLILFLLLQVLLSSIYCLETLF